MMKHNETSEYGIVYTEKREEIRDQPGNPRLFLYPERRGRHGKDKEARSRRYPPRSL